MRKRRWLMLCLILAAAFAGAGCSEREGKISTREETVINEKEESEEETLPEFSEEDGQNLYNAYVAIYNSMVGRFNDVLERYFKYVDYQEKFTLLEDDYSGISVISTFYDSLDKADGLVARKPEKSGLDEIYVELSPVMRELAMTLDEVAEYTDEESYKQDDFARGRELHAVIWKDYHVYRELGNEFLDALNAEASGKRADSMAQLQEEGYEATYAIVKLIDTAQQIQAAIYEQEIDDMLDLDIDVLQPLYDQFMEERQTVLDYLADEDAMYKEGYPTKSSYYATFEDAVENAGKELEEIFRRVRDQEPANGIQIESAFIVSGTIEGFDSKITAMINDYNTMLVY